MRSFLGLRAAAGPGSDPDQRLFCRSNTLAPTTSRDRTRSQSISLLATSFEFDICVHPLFSYDEDVIDRVAGAPSREIRWKINS